MHIGVNNLPKVATQLLLQVGFEPATCWLQVQRSIHCTTTPSSIQRTLARGHIASCHPSWWPCIRPLPVLCKHTGPWWAQSTHAYVCYNTPAGCKSPSKVQIPMVASGPPSNIWFLGPTWISPPNGVSISSAVFAQLTHVTYTPIYTDRQTVTHTVTSNICSNMPHLCNECMRCGLITLPCLRLNNLHAFRVWAIWINIRTNNHAFAKTWLCLKHFLQYYNVSGYLFSRHLANVRIEFWLYGSWKIN